jgi:hypothetical protein
MFDIFVLVLAVLCVCAWIYLLFFREGFWRCDQRLSVAGGEAR